MYDEQQSITLPLIYLIRSSVDIVSFETDSSKICIAESFTNVIVVSCLGKLKFPVIRCFKSYFNNCKQNIQVPNNVVCVFARCNKKMWSQWIAA